MRKLAMNGTLGWDRSCVIMEDRTVRCWVMDHSPAPVSGLTDVEDISIGEEHACALHVDGTVGSSRFSGIVSVQGGRHGREYG